MAPAAKALSYAGASCHQASRNRPTVNITWLDQADCQDSSCVGGKVAGRSRLAADHSVPPGFCLTTAAFREWARDGNDGSDSFPSQLLAQLHSSYAEMGQRTGSEALSVAVRSSAIDEDGRFASLAGQYETYRLRNRRPELFGELVAEQVRS